MQRFMVQATVVGVNDGSVLYPSCLQCYAKMLHNLHTGRWQCMRCNIRRTESDLSWRYRLSLCIADMSAICNLSLFGGILVQHFGCPASVFHQFLHSAEAISYGVDQEMVLGAVQTVLVGNHYVFCLKTGRPPQDSTSTAPCLVDRRASKHCSLADLLHAAAPASHKADGKLSDFVAVQMIAVSTRADTPTVLGILKKLVEDNHSCSLGERGARNTSESHPGKDIKASLRKGRLLAESCRIVDKSHLCGKGVEQCPYTPEDYDRCTELDTGNNQTILSEVSSCSESLSQRILSSQDMLRFSCQSSMDQEFASSFGSSVKESTETSHKEDLTIDQLTADQEYLSSLDNTLSSGNDPDCSWKDIKGSALTRHNVHSSDVTDKSHCQVDSSLLAEDGSEFSDFSNQNAECCLNMYNERTFPSVPRKRNNNSDSEPPDNSDGCDKATSPVGKKLDINIAFLNRSVVSCKAEDETVLDSQNTWADLDQSARATSMEEFVSKPRDSHPVELDHIRSTVAGSQVFSASFSTSLNDSSLLLAVHDVSPTQHHSLVLLQPDQSQRESVTADITEGMASIKQLESMTKNLVESFITGAEIMQGIVSHKQSENITNTRLADSSILLSQDGVAEGRLPKDMHSLKNMPDSEGLSQLSKYSVAESRSPADLDSLQDMPDSEGLSMFLQAMVGGQVIDSPHSALDRQDHSTTGLGKQTAQQCTRMGIEEQRYSTTQEIEVQGNAIHHETENKRHSRAQKKAQNTDYQGQSTRKKAQKKKYQRQSTQKKALNTEYQGQSTTLQGQGVSIYTSHNTVNPGRDDDEVSPDLFEDSMHSPSVLCSWPTFAGSTSMPQPVQLQDSGKCQGPCTSSRKVCACHLDSNCLCGEESEWLLHKHWQINNLDRFKLSKSDLHLCGNSIRNDTKTVGLLKDSDQTVWHKNPHRMSLPKKRHIILSHQSKVKHCSSGTTPQRTASNLDPHKTGLDNYPHVMSSHRNAERFVTFEDSQNCVSKKQHCEAKSPTSVLRPKHCHCTRTSGSCGEDPQCWTLSRGELRALLMPDSEDLDAILGNQLDRPENLHTDITRGNNTDLLDKPAHPPNSDATRGNDSNCTAGNNTGGTAGNNTGGTAGNNTGGTAGNNTGGTAGNNTGGTAGNNTGGARPSDMNTDRSRSSYSDWHSIGVVLSNNLTEDCVLDGSADLFSQNTLGAEGIVSTECSLDSLTSSVLFCASGVQLALPCRCDGSPREERDQNTQKTILYSSSSVDNTVGSLVGKSDQSSFLSRTQAVQHKISSQDPHQQQARRVRFSCKRRISSVAKSGFQLEQYCSPQQKSQWQKRDVPVTPYRSCLRQVRYPPISHCSVSPSGKSVRSCSRSALTPIMADTHNIDRTLCLSSTQDKTRMFSTPVTSRPQAAFPHIIFSSTPLMEKRHFTQDTMAGEISGSQDIFSPSSQDRTVFDETLIQETPKLYKHRLAHNSSVTTQRSRESTPSFSSTFYSRGRPGFSGSDILFDDSENDMVLQSSPVVCSHPQSEQDARDAAGSRSEAYAVAKDTTARRSVRLDPLSGWSMSPDLFSP